MPSPLILAKKPLLLVLIRMVLVTVVDAFPTKMANQNLKNSVVLTAELDRDDRISDEDRARFLMVAKLKRTVREPSN